MQKKKKVLLRRFLDDAYTKQEAAQVMESIANTETAPLFEELADEVWEESKYEDVTTEREKEKYREEARLLLTSIQKTSKQLWIRIGTAVASVAVIIGLVWGINYYADYINEQQQTYLEAGTSYGEKRKIILPDETVLILNACSRVRYPRSFVGSERHIELEGEAYLKVSRDESKPFLIKTDRFDLQVLGTSFNVKAYSTDEIVSVSVESGKVQVDLPEANMRLVASEQVYINTLLDEYVKRREKGRDVAAWINGTLFFNSTPVRDVAKELERFYDCRITFAENQLFDNLISGEHDNKDLESVLKSIEYTSNIKYKKDGKNILLYK